MKIVMTTATVLVLLVTPAMAQMGRHKKGDDASAARATSKVDEKAYKAALERIPEPKQKYDPWAGVVPPQPNKKP